MQTSPKFDIFELSVPEAFTMTAGPKEFPHRLELHNKSSHAAISRVCGVGGGCGVCVYVGGCAQPC